MSCLRALSRQVAGAGAGALSWLCTWWRQGWCWALAVREVEAGCRVPVPGAGAGCCVAELLFLGCRCRCRVLVLAVVLVLGAVSCLCAWWRHGAGAVSWQCTLARFRKGVWCCGPGCWCCELAERAFKTGGVGCWRRKAHRCWCQLIVRAVEVSWLCRLRTFLFQPVACQQVVGFCLAIWVYAGVIF